MTRRGATPRKQWRELNLRLPNWDFLRPLAIGVSVVAVLGSAVAGVRWLTPDSVQWDVSGEMLFQDDDEVAKVLEQYEAYTYWQLSLSDIEQHLQALPWLDQVRLERQWPDRIQVHLTEQTPLAFWNNDAFINSRGEVFGPSEVAFELPRLAGPDGQSPEVMANYLRFSQMFGTMGYRIEALTLASRGAWVL
ncbi:MAG: FtsQ-type POTRA domain-containing protein, partial [Natronospirillum sp.]